MIRSQRSGSIVSTAPPEAMPALAMTTSIPPKRSSVPATAASSSSRTVTSVSNQTASFPHAAATFSSSSGSRPTRLSFAPRAARRLAVSAPMPRAAPVIRTVLPVTGYVEGLMGGSVVLCAARGHADHPGMRRSFDGFAATNPPAVRPTAEQEM